MATCINSSWSCLPPFYTIPLLNRKIFHLLVSFLFLLHSLSSEEYNSLRLFIVVYTLVVFMSCCRNCMYATFIATIDNMGKL